MMCKNKTCKNSGSDLIQISDLMDPEIEEDQELDVNHVEWSFMLTKSIPLLLIFKEKWKMKGQINKYLL